MSTYTQILYQIIFSTKNREQTIFNARKEELYKYIWGILKNNGCHLYRIGGTSDHLHILIELHPSIALATLVKDVKVASSIEIKKMKMFPLFDGWQKGYAGFTYSFKEKDRLIEYVKNQEAHHEKITFVEELEALLVEHGVKYDPKYLL